MLLSAKELLARQWAFAADPLFGAIAADGADPLAPYHQETVAFLDAAVRLAQQLPDSPSAQMKQCTGLEGLLGVIRERLTVQERASARRRASVDRIDRLASVYTAMAAGSPVGLPAVATLAEELLDDARHGRPLRFVHVPVDSTTAYPEAALPDASPLRGGPCDQCGTGGGATRSIRHGMGQPPASGGPGRALDRLWRDDTSRRCSGAGGRIDSRRTTDGRWPCSAGAEMILRCFPAIAPLAAAVAAHHERTDGTGYPTGLRGTTIPTLGRLLAVADVYAALNEPRPHRAGRDGRAALTEVLLLAEHGLLDREHAALLVRLSFYPVGTVVELTDGRVGVVVANHPNPDDPRAPGRPVVAILASSEGALLPHPEHVDLATADRGGILRAVPLDRQRELLGHRYPDLV